MGEKKRENWKQLMFRARHSIRATNLGQAVSDLNSVQTCKLLLTSSYLVAAEYLAKGYKLSDGILQRAIHLDCDFTLCIIVSYFDDFPRQPRRESRSAFSITSSLSTSRLVLNLSR